MIRDHDTRFDDTLREFLHHRAADTAAVRDASAMSAAIATRLPGRARRWQGGFAGRLVLVATLAALLLLTVASLFVGSQRPPVPPSLGNGAIAYATQSGLSPVYLVRPGEVPRQIIPSESGVGNSVVCPTFSPDGRMLAVGMPGGSIVVLTVDEFGVVGAGSRLRSLASEAAHCPAWAPDGSAVAFLDGSALEIDSLVGEPRRIEGWETAAGIDATTFATDYQSDRAVQWSPDGATIAVARPSGTWLVPVDLAPPHRLHDSAASTVSWSPDGTRLVVWTLEGTLVISVRDGVVEATLPPGRQPVWSPRGDRIAYTNDESHVVVVGPDGADPRTVSDYGYNITWSPDGTQIMYIRDVSSHGYALMSQAIDVDGTAVGNTVTLVPMVEIATARSWPPAQSFSWQPVPMSPAPAPSVTPTASLPALGLPGVRESMAGEFGWTGALGSSAGMHSVTADPSSPGEFRQIQLIFAVEDDCFAYGTHPEPTPVTIAAFNGLYVEPYEDPGVLFIVPRGEARTGAYALALDDRTLCVYLSWDPETTQVELDAARQVMETIRAQPFGPDGIRINFTLPDGWDTG